MTDKLRERNIVAEKDLGHSRIQLGDDGVLIMYCDDDVVYEESQIREIVDATGILTGGKKYPQITIAGKYTSITREARDFIATDESVKYNSAEAYIIQSLAQRILANFYLKFSVPKVPTKVFTDRGKAEEWIRQFIK